MDYVKAGDSVHWYTVEGEPRHEATMREARKEALLPSVTTITKILANPGLELWKQNQLLLASLTLPRERGESDGEFADRVVEDSRAHGKAAGETGTFVHGWIAEYLSGREGDPGDMKGSLELVKDWIDTNVDRPLRIEYILAGNGYAGTVDALLRLRNGTVARVDWKTQGVKDPGVGKNGKPLKPRVNYYDTWPMQLAAYGAIDEANAVNTSVVINSNPEFPNIWFREWSNQEISNALKAFHACHLLWRYTNKFWEDE